MGESGIRKICVVTGNRAEYSKLKPVMQEINSRPDLDLILIVTASHLLDDFGKTIEVIKEDGFKISAVARTVAAGEDLGSMVKSVGLCALELPTLFDFYNPDIVLITGDRFDVLGVAVSAAFMNIPLAHMEGGEVTGAIDESVRHAITKFAHIHFPATEKSAQRLIKMGERPELVFNVGSPSADVILEKKGKPFDENLLEKYHIFKKPFLLAIQHPVTTEYDKCKEQMKETLLAFSELDMHALMLFPNVDAGSKDMVREIRLLKESGRLDKVSFWKNVPFEDYIALMAQAVCFVGNSSSGMRETCYFGTPTVNIGTRQQGRERGRNVVDVNHNKEEIKQAVLSAMSHGKYEPEHIYGSGNSSQKIAHTLSGLDLRNIIQKKTTLV